MAIAQLTPSVPRAAGASSSVAALVDHWRALRNSLDREAAGDAELAAVVEQEQVCRMRMARAQSRSLAELRMKLAVLYADLTDGMDPRSHGDAVNGFLLASALADLSALEGDAAAQSVAGDGAAVAA